jgi:hypothetical protein
LIAAATSITAATFTQRRVVSAIIGNAFHKKTFTTVWQQFPIWQQVPGPFDLIIDLVSSDNAIKMASAYCFGNGEIVDDHLR